MPLFAGFRARRNYNIGSTLLVASEMAEQPTQSRDFLWKSIACLTKAVALKPDFEYARHNLGIAYYRSGQLLYLAASSLASEDMSSLSDNFLSGSREAFLNSLAVLDTAVELMPDAPDVHNSRGNTLVALNRDDDALAEYDIAITLNPTYGKARKNRALLLEMQNVEKGLEELDWLQRVAGNQSPFRWHSQ